MICDEYAEHASTYNIRRGIFFQEVDKRETTGTTCQPFMSAGLGLSGSGLTARPLVGS